MSVIKNIRLKIWPLAWPFKITRGHGNWQRSIRHHDNINLP